MKKGFTLIEILIVVAIIAILASVVLVGLGPTQQSGRDARRLSDLHEIQNGLELYYNKCGGYPGKGDAACTAAIASAASYGSNAAGSVYGGVATNLNTALSTTLPQDPSANASYYYNPNNTASLATSYVIGAKLENGNNAAFVNYNPPAMFAGNGDIASMGSCTAANKTYCIGL